MEGVEIKMAKIEEHLKNQDATVSRIEKKIDDFICSADIKYANKKETDLRFNTIEQERLSKLEKIVYGVIGLIMVAFIGALIGLVFIK